MTSALDQPLTVTCPEDLLALAPLVLGFAPADSVVLLSFAGDRPFHARVDLPRERGDIDEVVAALAGPVRRHRVSLVAVLVFGGDATLAQVTVAALVAALERGGTRVLEALRADGDRYWRLPPGRGGRDRGIPFDVTGHRFAVHGVVHGRVTLGSREELAATLAVDPAAAAAVARRLSSVPDGQEPVASGLWARAVVSDAVSRGALLPDDQLARLLVALRSLPARDDVWLLLRRELAREWVEFWADVVRRSPAGLVAPPAALLGFGAWVGGSGALAWCAVDRAVADDPDYGLARLLAETLTRAVHPSAWEEIARSCTPSAPA